MRSGIGSRQHQCEVPPRARGRVVVHTIHSRVLGNTPACAGEERDHRRFRPLDLEIPPRARGRASGGRGCWRGSGNTPACAGKSHASATHSTDPQKYPRVRGEEPPWERDGAAGLEIPPRARGRALPGVSRSRIAGNTPACAGKSTPPAKTGQHPRKYPRVRGEEEIPKGGTLSYMEIPPRARGRAGSDQGHQARRGNTPACAGKSALILDRMPTPRKYPRVRGEEQPAPWTLDTMPEIPPRARGRATVGT